MSDSAVSVFDLSSAEKLQLVEDLWDDLAATPSDVPLHDWQIEELERRKANLMSHPGTGLRWEEVKRKVRAHYGKIGTVTYFFSPQPTFPSVFLGRPTGSGRENNR